MAEWSPRHRRAFPNDLEMGKRRSLDFNRLAKQTAKGKLVSLNDDEIRRFSKVTHGLRAIVFLGQSGSLSLDAIKWCEAQGIAMCLFDWYGELLSVTQPALKADVAIRRAQFAANRL